jgi:hypothetical protein
MKSANRKAKLTVVAVENPYFSADHAEGGSNPRRISAVVNLRESTVTTLASQGLLDAAQVAAAERFRRFWELIHAVKFAGGLSSVGGVGGGEQPNFAEMQGNARYELERARTLLGRHGFRLVSMICGEGYAVRDMGLGTRRQRDTAIDMLRVHLDELARLWNFATR